MEIEQGVRGQHSQGVSGWLELNAPVDSSLSFTKEENFEKVGLDGKENIRGGIGMVEVWYEKIRDWNPQM